MNILAIDYGTKNIGLAWIDTDVGVVLPYGKMRNDDVGIKELVALVKREYMEKIIMGLPIGLDGNENPNTKNIREFVETLKKEIEAPIEFMDERFTSAEADRMGDGGASRDEKAAMVILQAYVDRMGAS